jgi:hypothetical protein
MIHISLANLQGLDKSLLVNVHGSQIKMFQGIWTKHLQFYLDMANDAARTAKYSAFLWSQSSGVFHFGTSASNDVGSVWYAPNQVRCRLRTQPIQKLILQTQGGSIFTPKTSASGLAAHVAAAKYGTC